MDKDRQVVGIDQVPVVGARIEPLEKGWTIDLSRDLEQKPNNWRQITAIKRIYELDYAVKLSLERGNSVKLYIDLNQTKIDGAHSATEQILPLLLPLRIQDNLYKYQREGVAWLLRRDRALLGDDMGLGKTAQAVSAARRLIRFGRVSWVLVVCPRTLITNWIAEINDWAPELTFATALPSNEDRETFWKRIVRRAHLVITSYEQLRDPALSLLKNPPDLIIADEAHRIRKIDSQSTLGIRKLKSSRMWALTGTPLEREAEDIAVILSLLMPSQFSVDAKNLPTATLRSRLRPYVLRRRKEQVLKELPTVITKNEVLDMLDEQKLAYQAAVNSYIRRRHNQSFLAHFNRLRLLCDIDPTTGMSSKLNRIEDLLNEISLSNEKAVVFSYILQPLHNLKERLKMSQNQIGFTLLTGDMTLERREIEIDRFKSARDCTALLASTRIASEGLTLTEANHVLFINQWWNPSSNAQARDRVVRIGQKKSVNVRTFTCKGTVEERLETLLAEKEQSFAELVDQIAKSYEEEENLDIS